MSDTASPKTNEPVAEKVKRWLRSTGAPFEMATARTVLSHGLGLQQGQTYIDPEEGTHREIDVVASSSLSFGDNATLELAAVFECKNAPTPWVLYRSPPHYSQADPHFDRIASPEGERWLAKAQFIDGLLRSPLWIREVRPAYGLGTSALGPKGEGGSQPREGASKPKDNQPDRAHEALFQVVKASLALAQQVGKAGRVRRFVVVFPVIAVRGLLFEAWLEDGDVVVHETERGQVHWSYPGSTHGRVLVEVVTERGLDRLVSDIKAAADAMKAQEAVDVATEMLKLRPASMLPAYRPPTM